MSIIDDPMLALIVRFIAKKEHHGEADEAFIKRQSVIFQNYLNRFPKEEQEAKAMEWITAHAANYRQEWQAKTLPKHDAKERCPDCPLHHHGDEPVCNIHKEWLVLLKQYLDNDIDPNRYINEALGLLQRNCENLKVSDTKS